MCVTNKSKYIGSLCSIYFFLGKTQDGHYEAAWCVPASPSSRVLGFQCMQRYSLGLTCLTVSFCFGQRIAWDFQTDKGFYTLNRARIAVSLNVCWQYWVTVITISFKCHGWSSLWTWMDLESCGNWWDTPLRPPVRHFEEEEKENTLWVASSQRLGAGMGLRTGEKPA